MRQLKDTMNKAPLNQATAAFGRRTDSTRAFTLTELLAVLATVALLAAEMLSVSFTSREGCFRAICVSNLRQVGTGMSLYATEANDYVPICGWPNGQNPWQSEEACRVDPGTTNVTRGFESLGLLFRTKAVTDARIFYCPSLGRLNVTRTYDYYATAPYSWPSTPVNSDDDNIRTGYNYYPQLRVTEGGLPKLSYANVRLEFGTQLSLVAPAKLAELNPQKSITTDSSETLAVLSHQSSGSVAGLNALFPDGHVAFQNARNDSQFLSASLWDQSDTSTSTLSFRRRMNRWNP